MAWSLEGSYVETCSCNAPCPCTVSLTLGADKDRCNALLGFHIEQGEIDGTDVSGLNVAAIADTPKYMHEGNWRLGLAIDDRASDEQAEKLQAVFGGEKGGPMELFAPLIGEVLGVERSGMDIGDDGLRHHVKIGDGVDVEIEDIVPFGSEGDPVRWQNVAHPAGSELTAAQATRSAIKLHGIEFEGNSGFSTHFAWSG